MRQTSRVQSRSTAANLKGRAILWWAIGSLVWLPPDLGRCCGMVTTHRSQYRCSLRIDHPTSQGRSDCGVDQRGQGAAVVQRTHRSDRNTEGAVMPDPVMPHGHPPQAPKGRYLGMSRYDPRDRSR